MVDGSLPILFVGARAGSVPRLWNERSLEIEMNKMSEGARRGSFTYINPKIAAGGC